MSLAGAMNTAVSALKAQSQALSMISNNLANSSTTGYKGVSTSFSSLVTQQFSTTSYPGGGVTTSVRQNVDAQGLISATTNNTDLAIDGNGFFVVTYGQDGKEDFYTRDGEFSVNKEGYLVLGNYYLQGAKTDTYGKIVGNIANPEPIKVNINDKQAIPTTTEAIKANLPSTAAVGATFSTSMEVFDAQGGASTVSLTFEKTAANAWKLSFGNLTSDGGAPTGTISPTSLSLTFDGNGKLTSNATETLALTWTNGSTSPSSIKLDLGKEGSLSQQNTGTGLSITSIVGDGAVPGSYTGVEIGKDGTIFAKYDNGLQVPISKMAIATFPNPDGLSAMSNGIYAQSSSSGKHDIYHVAGDGGTGIIKSSSLEASNVDTGTEFTRMIVAQQAYSAASQVISTAKDMYSSLISAVR
ncbi:flagellar hook protein FlgE [Magnetospirillum molischianum]|uniref:Flagellar hook protein FlgE n=1 Tax=Magnetospirillum molischianum DSM 120 TaxID=1150626 RepID=H8FWC3_MAGML|nr:flagellar hook protein FlgE [Magnetospirillum molischianum]CCG42661.1 putative flagellar hook protein FlgE [Magnetospirillum molischianum DSM 120]